MWLCKALMVLSGVLPWINVSNPPTGPTEALKGYGRDDSYWETQKGPVPARSTPLGEQNETETGPIWETHLARLPAPWNARQRPSRLIEKSTSGVLGVEQQPQTEKVVWGCIRPDGLRQTSGRFSRSAGHRSALNTTSKKNKRVRGRPRCGRHQPGCSRPDPHAWSAGPASCRTRSGCTGRGRSPRWCA